MTFRFPLRRRTAAIAAMALILALALLWLARTFVAARLAELYLLTRGVPAVIDIQRLDWQGLDASARLGARKTPDLSIRHIHAELDGALIPRLQSLTLSHSVLRLRFDGKRLTFGTLQPLIDAALAPQTKALPTPASPAERPLAISLRDARILAFTPAGVVTLAGNGRIKGETIERFQGVIGRANLRAQGFGFLLSGGSFAVRSAGNGLALYVRSYGRGLRFKGMRAGKTQVMLTVSGLGAKGFASARGDLSAEVLRGADMQAARMTLTAQLGPWKHESNRWTGALDAQIRLDQAKLKEATVSQTALHVQSPAAQLEKRAFLVPLTARLSIGDAHYRFGSASLGIAALQSKAKGEIRVGSDIKASLAVSLNADIATPVADGLRLARKLPLLGKDKRQVRAMALALKEARLDVPDIYIGKSSGLTVTLPETATLQSRNGARFHLSQRGELLLARDAMGRWTGGFSASLSGSHLPQVALDMPRFSASEMGRGLFFDSQIVLDAKASFSSFRDARIMTRGRLSGDSGQYRFVPQGCARVLLGAYVSRKNDTLKDLHTSLCPLPRQPLLSTAAENWHLASEWRGLSVSLDSAGATAKSESGRIDIAGNGSGPRDGSVETAQIRITDNQATPRFFPLSASGRLNLADGIWQGTIGAAIAKTKRKVASVTVRYDGSTAKGRAEILSDLSFTPDDLQPAQLSPLLAALTQANGTSHFRGEIVWTAEGERSGGVLEIENADFNGPLGAVKKAGTRILFTSLAPLATAPGQVLSAEKIEWLVPLSALSLRFRLGESAVRIESLTVEAAGGHLALAPMSIALDPRSTASGTLKLDHFNLGALVAASNLADKVSLDAPVTGTIPFRAGADGLHITGGFLASTGPSRLSIKRSVWTGSKPQEKTDAITDFAYQALENLAIDSLEARLDSLPQGRLGVVFHIKGRNDPAVSGETRLSLIELVRGHAFDKPLPLPKGTPVDLTLDTSLNFDELLDAYRNAFSASVAEAAAGAEQDERTTP